MKILYISRAFFPSKTSNSLSIMRMAQAFHDQGHEVVLVGNLSESASTEEIFAFYGLRGGFSLVCQTLFSEPISGRLRSAIHRHLVSPFQNRKICQVFEPDLLYSRLTFSELALIPTRRHLIYEMHSPGLLASSRITAGAFRLLLRRFDVDAIVVTTQTLASYVKSALPNRRVIIAPLSAERPISKHALAQSNIQLKECVKGSCIGQVGYTGFLDTGRLRGIDRIILIAAEFPEACFHIVGGDVDAVAHWLKFNQRVNPNPNVHFYGRQNPEEIPHFLDKFDVVLSPLRYRQTKSTPFGKNASPLKIPQYLAYGKAIIASDIPSHREYLEDERTAILVPEGGIGEWVKSIKRILGDAAQREALQRAGLQLYEDRYTPEHRVRTILMPR